MRHFLGQACVLLQDPAEDVEQDERVLIVLVQRVKALASVVPRPPFLVREHHVRLADLLELVLHLQLLLVIHVVVLPHFRCEAVRVVLERQAPVCGLDGRQVCRLLHSEDGVVVFALGLRLAQRVQALLRLHIGLEGHGPLVVRDGQLELPLSLVAEATALPGLHPPVVGVALQGLCAVLNGLGILLHVHQWHRPAHVQVLLEHRGRGLHGHRLGKGIHTPLERVLRHVRLAGGDDALHGRHLLLQRDCILMLWLQR
mmetsp:Transcript_111297/g.193127  ORF Transcript_111297/g.193127 Transcript_111297/m.193127 type:complete len:257 (-) Transcript_111297:674-1444(-)